MYLWRFLAVEALLVELEKMSVGNLEYFAFKGNQPS